MVVVLGGTKGICFPGIPIHRDFSTVRGKNPGDPLSRTRDGHVSGVNWPPLRGGQFLKSSISREVDLLEMENPDPFSVKTIPDQGNPDRVLRVVM